MFFSLPWFSRATLTADDGMHMAANHAANMEESAQEDFAPGPMTVIDKPQLQQILQQAVTQRLPVKLNSPHLGAWTASRLCDVDTTGHLLCISQLIGMPLHEGPTIGERFNLMLQHDDASILVSMSLEKLEQRDRQTCYVASLPIWAVSSQMRAWRRTRLTATQPLTLIRSDNNGKVLTARVTDISEGGLCLLLPQSTPRLIQPHEQWPQVMLSNGNTSIGPLALSVQNIRDQGLHQRIGLAITSSSEAQMQRLRQLLMLLQSRGH